MMFHRALPELNGLGVTTFTPDLIRSDQFEMWSGLPFRTTNTTTEFVTIPWSGPTVSQLEDTSPAFTSLAMSGSREKLTTSADWPSTTSFASVPEAPNDVDTVIPLPAAVFWNAVMSLVYALFGVE